MPKSTERFETAVVYEPTEPVTEMLAEPAPCPAGRTVSKGPVCAGVLFTNHWSAGVPAKGAFVLTPAMTRMSKMRRILVNRKKRI